MGWMVDEMNLLQDPAGVQGTAGWRAARETTPALSVAGGVGFLLHRFGAPPSLRSRPSICSEQTSRRAPCAHACGVTVTLPTCKAGSCDHDPLSQKLPHVCSDL